jgi:uncharacterized membrane protein
MSDPFLWVKWVHIVSATLPFGTGLGSAFHMSATHLGGRQEAIAGTLKNLVFADWLFIATSGVVQPVSGALLVHMGGHDPWAPWLLISYGLYLLAAFCWFPVVWIQIRLRDMSRTASASGQDLPPDYQRLMRIWFWLGWPAFLALIAVFVLMVFKPA